MDDVRFGPIARALRHRLGLPQREVALRAESSQDLVSRAERGRVANITVGRLRRLLAVFDADLVLYVRWRGGEIDRLIDRAHARLGEQTARPFDALGWEVVAEVSYSEYGERGSIDLLAFHVPTSTLLVVELKSELTLIEETLRRHDAKTRLAARIARERFGWAATKVTRLLVLPNERTPRRRVQLHASLFARPYPLRGWALRRWLANPFHDVPSTGGGISTAGAISTAGGVLFLPSNDGVRRGHGSPTRRRIHGSRKAA
jgi:transcriptional regulator with XRE-family HTH domain